MAGKLARRSQAERRAATRAELLDAAERLFAEKGFVTASLAEIAEAAGVSKGAIYHHFATKDELLLALLDSHFQDRIDAVERIRSAEGVVEEIPFDRRWNLLFLEFVVRAARDEVFGKKFRRRLERLRERSAEGVERFLEGQEIASDLSPSDLAAGVAALGNGLAIEGLVGPRASSDALYASLLQVLLRGLEAEAGVRARKR